TQKLIPFLKIHGFKSLLNKYDNNEELATKQQNDSYQTYIIEQLAEYKNIQNYQLIDEIENLKKIINQCYEYPFIAIDCETNSLNAKLSELVGISLSYKEGTSFYIPLRHGTSSNDNQSDFISNSNNSIKQINFSDAINLIKPLFEDPSVLKVGHNIKFDALVMRQVHNGNILLNPIADTMCISYVLDAGRVDSHKLDELALRELNHNTIKFDDVCGKGKNKILFNQLSPQEALNYAAEDADITLRLHEYLWPQLEQEPGLRYVYEHIEMPAMRVLGIIERNGITIDSAKLAQQGQEVGKKLLALEKEIHELAKQPFNIQSPKQIAEILFGQLQLPVVKKTPSGAPSTDEEVLQKLAEDYPLPARILDYRSLAKLMSTYIEKLPRMINPKTGRVHTNYAQAVAVTGRLASNEPNLQNIPVRTEEGRRIREAFIPAKGYRLVSADYSQIELRIMAHIAEDDNLLAAFRAGKDIHQATAAEIFAIPLEQVSSEQRRYAKVINFGLIYGMSAYGLAGNLKIERAAAQKYIATYFERYPGVAAYMERTREEARSRGYVETVFGRRLWLPEIKASGPRRQGAERAAINAPMQGTAADLIKLAMVAVQDWLEREKLRTRMLLQVHDELVFEAAPDELEHLKSSLPGLMGSIAQLKVPLIVSIGVGDNWEEAH
ncbi:MAG: DNA polymerase I, partial [Polynucleobacter sp.]